MKTGKTTIRPIVVEKKKEGIYNSLLLKAENEQKTITPETFTTVCDS